MYFFTFIIIILLIFTNAITDAPNAIATLVGTKVMPFKKAAKLSAICNLFGIILMSFINISVANCISSMVNFDDGKMGIAVLTSGMLAVILFALIAMKFGIPTSETHGLIAGLTGSSLALYGTKAINWNEWNNVLIGLFWSIIGTYVISRLIKNISTNKICKMKKEVIEKLQIVGCCGMSFMHGAQDGQKFIGVLIIFISLMKGLNLGEYIDPIEFFPIIIFVAIIMFIGVSIGGKNIVQNIGSNMVKLDNYQAFESDISTVVTLFVASMMGLPVSTTHAKTISIIGVGNKAQTDESRVFNIIKAWIWTFPVCGGMAFVFAKLAIIIF